MMNDNTQIPISGKILAVDYGSKRIGLAMSDETQSIAKPVRVIKHRNTADDIKEIQRIIDAEKIVGVIIGVAMDEDGHLNTSGINSERFAKKIKIFCNLPVILWDEDFSTKDTKQNLIDAGIPKMKRRGHMDAHTAATIMHTFIDSRRKNI